ncbi:DUF3967 domain-containing protein [Bacillus sp. CGMCC 1.16541]|uniref:DUF3967 domain-containing protein n=1 Tax=Bacillus sp. CGMCC 1.16541 TaxID=2185143 RepID=UPI000D728C49|nr:DUF3967 domain-containing protein [Bacillus sp. CGMCC 1.16541]
MRNDLYYLSKDVAKRLSIEPVTVRKYSQMLEEQGYSFKKDEKNWRQYSEDDVHFLKYICHLKEMGKSLDESIQHVASLFRSRLNIANIATSLQQEEENPFLQFMKSQEEFNKKLLERMDQRDKNLMAAIRELQNTKKQIAAAARKKWWEFWK